MAPSKSKKASKAPAVDVQSSSPGQGQHDSYPSREMHSQQSLDTETLAAFMQKQKQSARSNRATRVAEIERNRKQGSAAVQKKMDGYRLEQEQKLRALHRPKVERLRALLAENRDLESKIRECYESIDQAYSATLSQLQVAIDDQIHSLQ